jgi:hypothetical protein
MSYHGMLHFHRFRMKYSAFTYARTTHTQHARRKVQLKHIFICRVSFSKRLKMSMGIVGVNSTAGREVKFIDPSKTTKSESSWLGYTLCDFCALPPLVYTHYQTLNIYVRGIRYNTSLYNEERRLGDQRGSDTLVVPFFTSNDGLSIAIFR